MVTEVTTICLDVYVPLGTCSLIHTTNLGLSTDATVGIELHDGIAR